MSERQGPAFARREPLSTYLACADYISSSTLRRFARGEESTGFVGARLGDAFHAFLLEQAEFEENYLALDGSVPAGRELSEEEVHGREWLTPEQIAGLRWARDAIDAYPSAPLGRWLRDGEKELSIYWTDARGGRWKARPDCFTPEMILELKTTTDVRPEAFARTRGRLGYDLQAAHYMEAVEQLIGIRPPFLFVTVELTLPRSLWVHEMSALDLESASRVLDDLRERYLRWARQ